MWLVFLSRDLWHNVMGCHMTAVSRDSNVYSISIVAFRCYAFIIFSLKKPLEHSRFLTWCISWLDTHVIKSKFPEFSEIPSVDKVWPKWPSIRPTGWYSRDFSILYATARRWRHVTFSKTVFFSQKRVILEQKWVISIKKIHTIMTWFWPLISGYAISRLELLRV